ncbi:MAG: TerB family tellurite resistance protein [Longimicrobiales bacterium]
MGAGAMLLLEVLGLMSPEVSQALDAMASWESRLSLLVLMISGLAYAVGLVQREPEDGRAPSQPSLGERARAAVGEIRNRIAWKTVPEAPDPKTAASALLLELALADGEFSDAERRYVQATLEEQFGLESRRAAAIVRRAEHASGDSQRSWCYADLLQRLMSCRQRVLLVDILNRLAGLEGEPDRREEYTVRRISALLGVEMNHV